MINLVNLLYVCWLCWLCCLFVPLVMVRPDSFPMFLIASGITSKHILLQHPASSPFCRKKGAQNEVEWPRTWRQCLDALDLLDGIHLHASCQGVGKGVPWNWKGVEVRVRARYDFDYISWHIWTIIFYFGLSIDIDLNRIRWCLSRTMVTLQ